MVFRKVFSFGNGVGLTACVALALAGCGGGGSTMTDATPLPMPIPVSLTDVTTDGEGYMAPEAGSIEIAAGGSATSGDVTFICTAGGDDCTVTVTDDGTITSTGGMVTAMDSSNYTMRLSASAPHMAANTAITMAVLAVEALNALSAEEEFTSAEALIEAAKTAVSDASALPMDQTDALNMRIEAAETVLADRRDDVMVAAMQLANVIDLVTNDERMVAGEYVGSWSWYQDTTDGGTYSAINKTHGNGGENLGSAILWHDETGELQYLVTLGKNNDDVNQPLSDDPYVDAYRYISTSEDPSVRQGFTTLRRPVPDHGLGSVWRVAELTQDYHGAGTLKVWIATDLAEADMAANPYAGEGDFAARGKIEFEGIPALPADRDYLFVYLDDGDSIAGSFDALAGEFSCANSAGCRFYTNHPTEAGYFTASDGVSFTPDGGTTQMVLPLVRDAEAAADYLAFGYWLYVPEDVTLTDAYEFGVFGSGGEPFDTANIQGLTGSATYAGNAAGMYYVDRSSQSPDTGSFTADVELTADFGTMSEWGTVSGEVSNFVFNGDVAAMFPATWALETNVYSGYRNFHGFAQGEQNIFDGYYGENFVQAGGYVHGWTWVDDHNGEAWYGDWNAKFFGNGALPTDHPNSITGTFNARQYYDTGTTDFDAEHGAEIGLSGAFGAHKQP